MVIQDMVNQFVVGNLVKFWSVRVIGFISGLGRSLYGHFQMGMASDGEFENLRLL